MATGHFYLEKAADSGPDVGSTAGSLITLLDWALDVVAAGGGGTRGWERVFYDAPNHTAVYRATTGQRVYIRVQDNVGSFQVARIRMYASMTDVDTGVDPSPNGSPQGTAHCNCIKADTTAGGEYFIVGDSRYFCLLTMRDNIGGYRHFVPFIFGEFNKFDPLDSYNTILIACGNTADVATYNQETKSFLNTGPTSYLSQSASYTPTGDNPNAFTVASPDGLIKSSGCAIHDPFNVFYIYNQGGAGLAHYGTGAVAVYQPYYVFDSNGASGVTFKTMFAVSGSNMYVRGTLPYIYATPYAALTGAVHRTPIIDGASSFIPVEIGQHDSDVKSVDNTSILFLRSSNDEPGRA